jgi:beta-glucanase (GH16 family)
MTNAASTGLTALPEQPRTISVQYGNDAVAGDISEAFVPAGSGTSVIEGFQSGTDKLVLPEGTDLSQVTVSAEWHGDAWGLTIRTAAEGDADVFLRWGWDFKPEIDLAVGGATDPVAAPEAPAEPVTEPAPVEGGTEETPVVETPVAETPAVEAPVAPRPVESGGSTEGYTLVLADDFSNGYDYGTWGAPFNGGTYWNGAFTWNADDVGVRDGEMQVRMTQQADGSWTAGGFNSFKAGNTITYGKIEFDAKVPNEQGTMTAILTWPATDVWPADGEIDILETPANENMFSTHYEGPDGEHWYDSVRSSSYDASQWNHYEMTWLPDRLTIEVNGQVMAEWTDPAHIPDVAHGFGAMGFVGAEFDQWMGGAPDGSTPDQVTVSIDNVRMYQATDAVL